MSCDDRETRIRGNQETPQDPRSVRASPTGWGARQADPGRSARSGEGEAGRMRSPRFCSDRCGGRCLGLRAQCLLTSFHQKSRNLKGGNRQNNDVDHDEVAPMLGYRSR